MATAQTELLLTAAVGHHQAGRLPQAEATYRQLLAADPNHVLGLQFLGVLSYQTGRNEAAIDLIGKAIALNGRMPDSHYNIGAALQAAGRLPEAAAHYEKAIALNPNFAEAHYEFGNVRERQDKLNEAATHYQHALTLRPNFVEALTNLGNVLRRQGRLDEAMERWRQALALQPTYIVARMNISVALSKQGRLDEAVAQLRQVLALKPDHAETLYNLGALLRSEGNIVDALELARRALAADETADTKSLVAMCLTSLPVHMGVGDLRALLVRSISEAWVRPSDLGITGARFLLFNEAIRDGVARASKAWPNLLPAEDLASPSDLAAFAQDPLLLALLESAPVCEVGLERFATALRFTLLGAARAGTPAEPNLKLYYALARQCFINNYVFTQSDAEKASALELRDELVTAIASGGAIDIASLVAVAAYFPLHTLPGAEQLMCRPWPDGIAALLAQQIAEPMEEQRARASIPALTAIEDDVSLQVRAQYEENPYPQWIRAEPAGKPVSVDSFVRKKFPHSLYADLGKTDVADILVAGCGTGRYSIATARRFNGAQVLAVDLSLTSLCYAQRMARSLGQRNIEFAQADIMRLPSIGRTFDMIECSGVLHHLDDPFAGWRALLVMLRPAGIMRLGLYSEVARRNVVAVRDFIAERGYRPSAEDIRRCRQELHDCAEGTALWQVTLSGDFYNTSECRDLLFHAQEIRLTLPEIASFIAANDLQLLGFDLDGRALRKYAQQFPADRTMTDLAQWHQFETENPDTFAAMYQFWVQKK